MPRAEPCPIPGCDQYKATGKPFCRDHWRALPTYWRALLVKILGWMRTAKMDGDSERFRGCARQFEYVRDRAGEIIIRKESRNASV